MCTKEQEGQKKKRDTRDMQQLSEEVAEEVVMNSQGQGQRGHKTWA